MRFDDALSIVAYTIGIFLGSLATLIFFESMESRSKRATGSLGHVSYCHRDSDLLYNMNNRVSSLSLARCDICNHHRRTSGCGGTPSL